MTGAPSKAAWILLALLVIAGGIGAYQYPNGPLLAGWLVLALSFGTWFAFGGGVTPLRQRIARLVVLHCVLVAAALLTSQMAARRLTSATHLRFNGVLIEQADSIVIASGMQGVDVIMPTISTTQVPWRMTMHRRDNGWQLARSANVEQVRITPLPESRLSKRYTVLNGVVLAEPGDSVRVRDPHGSVVDVLTLADDSGRMVLRSRNFGTYATEPTSSRLRSRFARMLRTGTSIGSLDGQRRTTAPFDRFVRVQKLAPGDDVNGAGAAQNAMFGGLLGTQQRFLVSSTAPFVIDDFTSTTTNTGLALPDSARVEVRHMGGLWRFDIVAMQREATASRGIAVRFGRNPRPLDTPLPSGDSCDPTVACGLLSLRRLPTPIAHVALDAAGFDPSRFALLARVRETDNGVSVLLPNDSVAIPLSESNGNAFTVVPVTPVASNGELQLISRAGEPQASRHWLLMSATSHHTDGAGKVLQVCLGVALLLFLVHRLIDRLTRSQSMPRVTNERALALGLNALLTLLLARLIIGARVTFFPPFNAAGVNTAIGMWVAVAVVTTGLLSWSRWAPVVLGFFNSLALHRSMKPGTMLTVARATMSHAAPPQEQRAIGTNIAMLLFPIVLLSMVSLQPVVLGAAAGSAVVLTWFLIAWVSAFSGRIFHSFETGPFEVIEFHGDSQRVEFHADSSRAESQDDAQHADGAHEASVAPRTRGIRFLAQLPERHLLFLALCWMLVLLSAKLVIIAALLPVIAMYGARSKLGVRLFGERAETASPALVALGQTVSVILVATLRAVSENGAMAAFLFIILVTLVSVRSGRALAARLPRTTDQSTLPWWTIALYLVVPMLLLVPLAFIDMGLLLVMSIPIGGAALLAVGAHRLSLTGRISAGAVGAALMYVLVFKVLFPDVSALRSNEPQTRAARFEQMQTFFGFRAPGAVGESFERAAARAVATRDQDAAERLLISAPPGAARDLLLLSIEQVWASKAYAASGAFGSGLGLAPIGGRGIAESVSYAENSYSVYILHEHGWVGGLAVLAAYLVFGVAVLLAVRKAAVIRTESMRATLALFMVATLIVIVPAVYVALSNLGVVPITGQNMPFLGLNAWSDVTLSAGIIGILITGAIRTEGIRG